MDQRSKPCKVLLKLVNFFTTYKRELKDFKVDSWMHKKVIVRHLFSHILIFFGLLDNIT